MNFRFGIPPTI